MSGIFKTHTELDATGIILNIDDLRGMLELQGQCSSVDVKIEESANPQIIEQKLNNYFNDSFVVKNRMHQRPFIHKMIKTEKLAVYIISLFILIISMLSLIASLIVLLMEKQRDIFILHSLGFSQKKLKTVFCLIGMLITLLGLGFGLFFGGVFSFLQDKFGIIKLGTNTSFLDAYPIKVHCPDIFIIILIVLCLGFLASYFVAKSHRFYNH